MRRQDGIFAAAAEGGGVLMDLPGDRYIALDEVEFPLWNTLVEGSGLDAAARLLAESHGFPAERARAKIEACLDRWTEDGLWGPNPQTPLALPTPKPAGQPARRRWSSPEAPRIQLRRLAAAAAAARRMPRLQRRHGLAGALWRLEHGPRPAPGTSRGTDEAARVLAAYAAYRKLMRWGQDCLVHSLTVGDLLRRRGFDADICFGIKTPPFYAHAWVELEGAAVLESLDRIAAYTVIARF